MTFRIVIPSARASNLIPCVQAILTQDPQVSPSSVIVVDDGARRESEAALPGLTWVAGVKPFVFARNVNRGIAMAGSADVILLNDDARLVTPDGFTRWDEALRHRPPMVCSAGIRGTVCNSRQVAQSTTAFRSEPQQLAFICVYLPRVVIAQVGLLDERFIGYGYDDFDFCLRARACGFPLGIWDGCVVDHGPDASSTYRSRSDFPQLFAESQRLYRQKWDERAW